MCKYSFFYLYINILFYSIYVDLTPSHMHTVCHVCYQFKFDYSYCVIKINFYNRSNQRLNQLNYVLDYALCYILAVVSSQVQHRMRGHGCIMI